MHTQKTHNITTLSSLQQLAASLSHTLISGDAICLNGDLGYGKTTFARMLISALYERDINVTSPTFNIVNQYESPKGMISHFDLYRINDLEEIYNIGLIDAIHDGLAIIEWPNIATSIIKKHALRIIHCNFTMQQNIRHLTISDKFPPNPAD